MKKLNVEIYSNEYATEVFLTQGEAKLSHTIYGDGLEQTQNGYIRNLFDEEEMDQETLNDYFDSATSDLEREKLGDLQALYTMATETPLEELRDLT